MRGCRRQEVLEIQCQLGQVPVRSGSICVRQRRKRWSQGWQGARPDFHFPFKLAASLLSWGKLHILATHRSEKAPPIWQPQALIRQFRQVHCIPRISAPKSCGPFTLTTLPPPPLPSTPIPSHAPATTPANAARPFTTLPFRLSWRQLCAVAAAGLVEFSILRVIPSPRLPIAAFD